MTRTIELTCACGTVHIAIDDDPIISAECHCDSCRTFSVKLQAVASSPSFVEANGGTRFDLYRKDRIRFDRGEELLREVRLTADAGTRRVVAGCCMTPIYLEFPHAHWVNVYAALRPDGSRYPIALRTMTSDLADPSVLPADVPNKKRQSAVFFAKLFAAWFAMGFRNPKLPPVQAVIHV